MMLRVQYFVFVQVFFWGVFAQAKTEVFFSPQDNVAQKLIEHIDKEEKQVLMAIYCLTHRGIADALIRAKRRGVDVDVLVDPFSLKSRFAVSKLKNASVKLSVWDPELVLPSQNGKEARKRRRRPLMHNKFCVFGNMVVWTGSYNCTYDATQFHRENVVVIGDKELAKTYEQQFYAIKEEACRVYDDYIALYPKRRKNVIDALKRR